MKALAMLRGKPGVHRIDVAAPKVVNPDDVLIRVKEVGLDGTDYTIVRHGPDLADDRDHLILGHEVAGVVTQVGSAVTSVAPGDAVCLTVRRGCGQCHPCLHNTSDMCLTGLFTERGIHKIDGFLSEYVVEREQYVVKVPPAQAGSAVLAEPVSIAEKAIEQIRIIQSRLAWTCPHPDHDFLKPDWGGCKTALVVGAGPLGLLCATLLRLAGVTTILADIVPDDHPKVGLVDIIGARYVDTRRRTPGEVMEYCEVHGGKVHMIIEASGAAEPALQLIPYMARSSIYVMTGIPPESLVLQIDAGQTIRQIVRFNQVIVGSVNSNRSHFEKALQSLDRIRTEFPDLPGRIMTHRVRLDQPDLAFGPKSPDHVKTIIEVDPW